MGRSEYVQGQRQRGTELEWSYAFVGAGLGYRLPVHPFQQDSAVNISLTYETGYRWFKETGHTSSQYGMPKDTYEGTHLSSSERLGVDGHRASVHRER